MLIYTGGLGAWIQRRFGACYQCNPPCPRPGLMMVASKARGALASIRSVRAMPPALTLSQGLTLVHFSALTHKNTLHTLNTP